MGTEPTCSSDVEAADAFASQMMKMQEEAKAALEHVADEMAWYYDRNQKATPEYKEGQKVWLSSRNYTTDRPTKKLDHKWIGPFRITKVVSPAAMKLQLPAQLKGVHPVVSVTNVHPTSQTRLLSAQQTPTLAQKLLME